MKKKLQMTDAEIYRALVDLIASGRVRPTGRYRNGQMVYECTPVAELSDENRAYAAYLNSLSGDTQVN